METTPTLLARANTARGNMEGSTGRGNTAGDTTLRPAPPGHTLDVPYVTLLCTATAPISRLMILAAAVLFVSIQSVLF